MHGTNEQFRLAVRRITALPLLNIDDIDAGFQDADVAVSNAKLGDIKLKELLCFLNNQLHVHVELEFQENFNTQNSATFSNECFDFFRLCH